MSRTRRPTTTPPAAAPGRPSWSQRWARLVAGLPMALALSAVTAVWVFGAVWSFNEQSAFATAKHFTDPALLPLVLDGLAISMAGVAFAASLDARPALSARAGTALAVLASATSNGLWAAERTQALAGPDLTTVALGVGIPIAANIAFEVLLAELRRQVQRRRGLPAPTPLPTLRPIRLLLAPRSTFTTWRGEVLHRTAPHLGPRAGAVAVDQAAASEQPELPVPPALSTDDDHDSGTGRDVRGEVSALDEQEAVVGACPVDDPPTDPGTRTAPGDATATSGSGDLLGQEPVVLPPSDTARNRPAHLEPDPPAGPEPRPAPAEIGSAHDDRLDDEAVTPTATSAASPTGPEPDAEPEPDPGSEPESRDLASGSASDPRVALLAERLAHHPDMTGRDAETALAAAGWDISYRTARRLLADARTTTSSTTGGEPIRDHEPARTGTDDSVAPTSLSLVRHAPTSASGDH